MSDIPDPVSDITATIYVGTSADGFIARTDNSVDFLDAIAPTKADGDLGFAEFMASVDVLVMGRNTFDFVMTMVENGAAWAYGDMPVIVLTTRPLDPPRPTVEAASLDPAMLLEELSYRGHKSVYVDGGMTAQAFLRAGLIDKIIITVVPVLIGDGIRLFGELDADLALTHEETIVFECGLTQTRYSTESATGD